MTCSKISCRSDFCRPNNLMVTDAKQ